MNGKLLTKFKVGSTVNAGNNNLTAHLSVVVSDAPENKSFSQYTPSGEIRLHITNPNAIDFFEPAEEYYVIFEKVIRNPIPTGDKIGNVADRLGSK